MGNYNVYRYLIRDIDIGKYYVTHWFITNNGVISLIYIYNTKHSNHNNFYKFLVLNSPDLNVFTCWHQWLLFMFNFKFHTLQYS